MTKTLAGFSEMHVVVARPLGKGQQAGRRVSAALPIAAAYASRENPMPVQATAMHEDGRHVPETSLRTK